MRVRYFGLEYWAISKRCRDVCLCYIAWKKAGKKDTKIVSQKSIFDWMVQKPSNVAEPKSETLKLIEPRQIECVEIERRSIDGRSTVLTHFTTSCLVILADKCSSCWSKASKTFLSLTKENLTWDVQSQNRFQCFCCCFSFELFSFKMVKFWGLFKFNEPVCLRLFSSWLTNCWSAQWGWTWKNWEKN